MTCYSEQESAHSDYWFCLCYHFGGCGIGYLHHFSCETPLSQQRHHGQGNRVYRQIRIRLASQRSALGRGLWGRSRAAEQKQAGAGNTQLVETCAHTVLEAPSPGASPWPGCLGRPIPLLRRAERTGILLGRALHRLLQGLAAFGAARRGLQV